MPKISKRVVDTMHPEAKDCFRWDTELKGFGLKVTPTGKKVYLLKYRMGGRAAPTRRFTIGEHGNPWTPDTARAKALRLRGMIADGIDPMVAEQERRSRAATVEGAMTVAGMVAEYLERWARPKKRSAPEDERTLEKDVLPHWRDRPIASISRRDVVTLLDGIVDRGSPIQANRAFATVRRMFNFAIERGIIEASPCVKIRAPGQERARDRNLSPEEIVQFWFALDRAPMEANLRRGLRFMLATGQRKGEVFGISEHEIDRAEQTWLIPVERSKNGREHLVPLSPLALEILGDRNPKKGDWLFPSSRTGDRYHPQAPDHALRDLFIERVRNKRRRQREDRPAPALAGIEPFTPHDLRRTCATRMRELSVARDDVSLVLNHKARGVTGQHYDRYDGLREKRHALEAWGAYLSRLLQPAPDNVVSIVARA